MTDLKTKIITRAEEIIALGEKIKDQPNHSVDTSDYSEWITSTKNLIRQVCGENSPYYADFVSTLDGPGHPKYYVDYGNGILNALLKDLEYGFLGQIENLVSAEVFTDFLDMAEHLLAAGYKDPAAFLVGATLEEGLRRISKINSISMLNSDDISSLSTKLVQAKILNEIKRKQVMAWKAIRDNADHGKFEQYTAEQVSTMLVGVRDFLAREM